MFSRNLFRIGIALTVLLVFTGCNQRQPCVLDPDKITTSTTPNSSHHPSPYTIEELEDFLLAIYKRHGYDKPIPRWEQQEIKYFVTSIKNGDYSPPTPEQQNIIRAYFNYYGRIIDKKFAQNEKKLKGDSDILLIYTDNLIEDVQRTKFNKYFFGLPKNSTKQQIVDSHIKNLIANKVNRLNVLLDNTVLDKKEIRSFQQLNNFQKNNFYYYIKLSFFNDYVTRIQHKAFFKKHNNKNFISLKNYYQKSNGDFGKYHLKRQTLYPLDEYYLKALYSNKVKKGMSVKKAIPLMACEIYQHYINNTPQETFNHQEQGQ